MNLETLATLIYKASYLQGDFVLRSGERSNEYFDKYRFESDPQLLKYISEHLCLLLPKDTQVLAGLELGGIPLCTALGIETGLPLSFVRKKAKDYGTQKIFEGAEINGRRVVIVEDIITTGGQVLESYKELKKAGALSLNIVCVIDRSEGKASLLKNNGIDYQSLFTAGDLKSAILKTKQFKD